jgi:hypothetical protein
MFGVPDEGPDFAAIPAPGLVIIPGEDPFLSADSATVLRDFWATLA